MRDLLHDVAPTIRRIVRGILGAAHPDFEDVLQVSTISFVGALPAFRFECAPSGLAARISARAAFAAARRRRREGARFDPSFDLDTLGAAEVAEATDFDRARRSSAVRDALARISEEQSETLTLRTVMGFSLAETAAATGVPLNTAKSRLRLAKDALRPILARSLSAHHMIPCTLIVAPPGVGPTPSHTPGASSA